jgi:hypothetical protein
MVALTGLWGLAASPVAAAQAPPLAWEEAWRIPADDLFVVGFADGVVALRMEPSGIGGESVAAPRAPERSGAGTT